jgi:hypothetical protein
LERNLGRGADPVCSDCLAFNTGNVFDAGSLRGKQPLAPAMRANKQLHIEALLKRLEPVAYQASTGIRLAGRKRLDERLPTCPLEEKFDVKIMLGVDALGDTEAERRMASSDFRPSKPYFRRGAGNGRREKLLAKNASGAGQADSTGRLKEHAPGRPSAPCSLFGHG